jgi:hypothetical protein
VRSNSKSIAGVVGRSLVSILCSLILGFIFYRWSIFRWNFPSFQIVAFAIVGSLFFFTLRIHKRNAFALLLVLFVIQAGLLTSSQRFSILLSNLVFYVAIAAALFIFFVTFYRKTAKLRNLHPLVLATLSALAFAVATVIMELIEGGVSMMSGAQMLSIVRFNSTNGFLVGLGIGLGILIVDKGYVALAGNTLRRFFEGTES